MTADPAARVTDPGRDIVDVAALAAESHAANVLALVAANPDALIVSGPDMTVRFVNEAACLLFGQPVSGLLGQRMTFSVAGGETTQIDIVSGSRHRVGEMRVVPIDWSGEAATLAVIRDVTDRRQILDQFHEAQKSDALGRLAGGVAHDFNNLLGVILSTAEVLGDLTEDPEARRLLAQIERAGDRAAAITGQLLKFSRKSPAQPQHLDLNTMVRDSLQMIKPVVGVDTRLRTDLDDTLGPVYIDPVQAEQVLMNLVLNARDALPRGGTITIGSRPAGSGSGGWPPAGIAGDHAALTVSDDGVGMTADVKERIFEPFFTTKTGGRGTGLGLAAVAGIVAQAGGHISVESAPGDGTTVTVLLPLADQPPPVTRSPRAEPPTGTGRILVAEDEQALREMVVRMLQRAGYEVRAAPDGAEALGIAEQYPFDLLLTDILMPTMNGYELAAEVVSRWPERAILLMTGYANAENDTDDTTRTLIKPFDRATLLQAVAEAVSSRPTPPAVETMSRHPAAARSGDLERLG